MPQGVALKEDADPALLRLAKPNMTFLLMKKTRAKGLCWALGFAVGFAVLFAEPMAVPNATNTFKIIGMHCAGCANGLRSELKMAPGVAAASVTLSNELAVVSYDTNRTTIKKLLKVIKESGFQGKMQP